MIKIQNTKANIYHLCHVHNGEMIELKFYPGLTHISDETFAKIKENKYFKIRLENGDFKAEIPLNSTNDASDKKELPRLGELLKDIKKIFDHEKLLEIKENDPRKMIRKAVDEQIKKITPTEEDYRDDKK